MNEQMKVIFEKIKAYNRIVIFRHKRPDGDAVGSTLGLRGILRLSYPQKEIIVNNCDYSDYVGFLGGEDPAMPDEFYTEALGIIIDTATSDTVSNPRYALCKEICKIDHHIPKESYGDYEWVEEHRSSSCEMIAAFYAAFKDELKIDVDTATLIYAGMVTDSGRFRFRSVSGDTMRLAGMLLDEGVDTDHLYANLYMKEFHTLKFQAEVYKKMKISENGVAYLYVSRAMQEKFGLTFEEACASVSYMDSIKNSLIWIAFIEADDGNIRVRLRSRFVTINQIAEKYNGGGHDCASGATVKSRSEMRRLIADADARLKEYKESNEGWL
ncbi:MAG: bifunctional oligoribonuclease/PAP phosphatase NrnA [Ruminococcaceae bacterium]|nr:bifunctional oligoribonuclease/PAP phosphatase NrnA [Oscillospiraceae bacterium]